MKRSKHKDSRAPASGGAVESISSSSDPFSGWTQRVVGFSVKYFTLILQTYSSPHDTIGGLNPPSKAIPDFIDRRPVSPFDARSPSHIYIGIYDPKDEDIRSRLQTILKNQRLVALLLIPFQSFKTKSFLDPYVFGHGNRATLFMIPEKICISSNSYVFVGVNLNTESTLIFIDLEMSSDAGRSETITDTTRNDEYYTYKGTWDFLPQVLDPTRHHRVFQAFVGQGHMKTQLQRLFTPQKVLSIPRPVSHIDFSRLPGQRGITQQGQLILREDASQQEKRLYTNRYYQRLLREADVVATNPPFSLKYQYIRHLVERNKPFILLLPQTCLFTHIFRTAFGSPHNLDKVGFLIPLPRVPFIVKKRDATGIAPKFKWPVSQTQYGVNPGFETVFVAWNIPSLTGEIRFLQNMNPSGSKRDGGFSLGILQPDRPTVLSPVKSPRDTMELDHGRTI